MEKRFFVGTVPDQIWHRTVHQNTKEEAIKRAQESVGSLARQGGSTALVVYEAVAKVALDPPPSTVTDLTKVEPKETSKKKK